MAVQMLTALITRAPLHRPLYRTFSSRSFKGGFPASKKLLNPPQPSNPESSEWKIFADRLKYVLQQNRILNKKIDRLGSLVEKWIAERTQIECKAGYPQIEGPFPIKRAAMALEWNEDVKNKALNLIFGSKKYMEFTLEEKEIVDFYQRKILEVSGGVVLPNTRIDLEQIAERRFSSSRPK